MPRKTHRKNMKGGFTEESMKGAENNPNWNPGSSLPESSQLSPPLVKDGEKNDGSGDTQPEQPINWMDILLTIGLGVCIFALLVMIYKLVFSYSSEDTTDKSIKKNDFTIFPGLFDEPITLFERGDSSDNKQNEINELKNEVSDIKQMLTKIVEKLNG